MLLQDNVLPKLFILHFPPKNITALANISWQTVLPLPQSNFQESLVIFWPREFPWPVPTLSPLAEILLLGSGPFILGTHLHSAFLLSPVSKG